jgi:hypothetical protein
MACYTFMSTKELIVREITDASEDFSVELLELIRALKLVRHQDSNEVSLVSQNILSKDWLSPEEDEAWKDL